MFFVLSGFLMIYAYWNRPPRSGIRDMAAFATRKVGRLYPIHLVMLFWGSVYMLLDNESIPEILKQLLLTVPLMQTWSPSGYQAINTVAWYLSVSLFLYFAFPHILRFIKARSASGRVIVLIAVYVLQIIIGYWTSQFDYNVVKWVTYCHPLYRTGDFLIGGLTASVYMDRPQSANASTVCSSLLEILALACNVAVCASYSIIRQDAPWFTYTCLFTPASVMLVYVFSRNSGTISRMLNNKVVLWLAAISPYGFLIHRIIVNYFYAFTVHVLKWEYTSFILVVSVPFVCTVIATYVYLAVERKTSDKIRGSHAFLHG